MALLDIFKKKKEKKERKKTSSVEIEEEKKKKQEKKIIESAEKKEEIKPEKPRAKISNTAYKILRTPHVSEKASDLVDSNQYVFKVFPRANKAEIKKAVEAVYGVKAVAVKIINIPAKKKRVGRIEGEKKGYKKAIVKLKEGQKIEVLPR